MSNVVLRGANELLWPRGFQIGVKLDALQTFLKSGVLRGHLKEVYGAQGSPRRPSLVKMCIIYLLRP